MPRYFFDVYDGTSDFKDSMGIDLDSTEIRGEVSNLLRLLAYAKVARDTPCLLVADVRNEKGRVVYHASAELRR